VAFKLIRESRVFSH